MKGFKDFIMKGNLIELAVAFIIATAFAKVVASFTAMVMDLVGKVGGTPNFSAWAPGGVHVGDFLTQAIAFVVVAFVVYYFVVKPYQAVRKAEPEAPAEDIALLSEIRDLLKKD